jgi:hypothetical protein
MYLCIYVCLHVCVHGPSPLQRKEYLQRTATALAEATHIVIAGGGPTGVEVAGEILSQFGRKNITLVHPRGRVLEQCPDRISHKAMARLVDEFNVDVILNDTLLIPAEELKVWCGADVWRVDNCLDDETPTVCLRMYVCESVRMHTVLAG